MTRIPHTHTHLFFLSVLSKENLFSFECQGHIKRLDIRTCMHTFVHTHRNANNNQYITTQLQKKYTYLRIVTFFLYQKIRRLSFQNNNNLRS